MTQLLVEEFSRTKQGNLLHLEVFINGQRLERDITYSKVDTVQKLAYWIVSQVEQHPNVAEIQPRRQAVIDYHIDSSLGIVIDNIDVSLLVEDQALEDIEALPGWANWTGDQAEAWIEANVTNLATTKTALKSMARLIVAERDAIRKLVEKTAA